ncbi:MAG: heme exporter protein CcmB [Gammaproteobacteria bacterium]|nr:heme exporter protein CcmB [Gammaproteobacteria bacterium]MCF6229250.1 heme exporter protein CcmB [Gammaproteobacteria bacterium]
MFSVINLMVRRDILLAMRRPQDVMTSLFFFIIVVSLFPLGVSPEMEILRTIGPGVIWVAALLATMLSLGRLFSADYQDGTLEQMILSPQPLALMVLSKAVAHWLLTGVPLVMLTPLLGLLLGLGGEEIKVLTLTLLLGTPVLILIGSIGAALTLGVRGGGVLLSLLILPLFVPVLIFGTGAVSSMNAGMGVEAHFSLLGAFLILSLLLTPWASAAALKISME